MKRILWSMALIFCLQKAGAQKIYFTYIQAETEKAFAVRINEKQYLSSPAGYLILSKLQDTTYQLSVSFPSGEWPVQHFTITMGRRDRGFLLKNFGDKGWGLFDLQTLSVIHAAGAVKPATTAGENSGKQQVSVFTKILSQVSNDPSLLAYSGMPGEEEIVKMEEKKKEPVPEKVVSESAITTTRNQNNFNTLQVKENPVQDVAAAKQEMKKDSIAQTVAPATNVQQQNHEKQETFPGFHVQKKSESSTTEGFGLVFTDEVDAGKYDTIRILIPNPARWPAAAEVDSNENSTGKVPVFLNGDSLHISVVEELQKEQPVVEKSSLSPCPVLAEENEINLLKEKLLLITDEEDRISEARKFFKMKCVTVAALRQLAMLFNKDEHKYRFFDVAYSGTADPVHFPALEAELQDAYYKNRFRAMLR